MSVDDSAFDGFLRQVAHMHTLGKASFEAEFDVSQLGLGLLLRAHHQVYISFFCTHTCAHTRTTYTHTHAHTHTQHTHLYTHVCMLMQSIDMKTASSTVVAELNNAQNRYKNIFPCEWLW